MQRIAFENAYESSIIFQSFLYANVPLCAHFLSSKVSCRFYFLSSRNCKADMWSIKNIYPDWKPIPTSAATKKNKK